MKRSLVVAVALTLAACGNGSGESAPPATPATPPAPSAEHGADHPHAKKGDGPVKAPGEASVGDTTTCPVSGEEFVVEASSPKAEHDGKTYYFCCAPCKAKFEANPVKYLEKT